MKKILPFILLSIFSFTTLSSQEVIADLQKKLHSIADNESSSVVFISTEKTIKQNYQSMDPFEFFFNTPRGNNGNEKQREFKQSALGSGVIYSKKGDDYFIITNNHVVDGADKVKITIDGRKQYDATIVGGDQYVDIAVIKVNTKDKLRIAQIGDSSKLRTADFVIAIGNPYGLSHSVTFGIISALGRSDLDNSKPGFTNFIQTDAAINPGNSGGPLLNIDGEVIGINTMIYSQTGGSVGIGFAIPMNIAKGIADQLINKGKIEHGWIGISFQELDKERLDKLGLKNNNFGMLVLQVVKDGPSDKAGIKAGDILTKINNKDLVKSSDLTIAVGNASPGEKISVTFMRENKILMKYITVGKRGDDTVASAAKDDKSDNSPNKYGLTLSETKSGLLVDGIISGSQAQATGFQKGDILFKINNTLVKTIKEFNEATKNSSETAYFFVNRDGNTIIIMM